VISPRTHMLAAFAVIACTSLYSADARAQDAGVDDAATAPASPHPAGIADRPGEAPGSTGLVALPGESLPRNAQVPTPSTGAAGDAASANAMAFNANTGQCRDTIPGGPILAAAYACILALLGAYAFMIGRKNAQLGAQLDELERLLAKKSERAEG
jgi:hypothetical protein